MPDTEPKINASDWILSISTDGGVTYKPVACLTDNDFSSEIPEIDVSSKCGPAFLPGVKLKQPITASGWTIDQGLNPSKVSADELYDLHVNQTVVGLMIGPADLTTGVTYYTGDGFITNWKETGSYGDAVKFDITATISEPPMTPHREY